ncbi:probable WRKY transcription factor 54 isoform X2 [Dioscorea cayenensis subsp. rotundata]|uniref:Probable WRKY transcription factor 54 isoform X2 n=1 Tax=Dioscorea cayennensis subsp. rotundata TaxID=55577 RepID=A0AB40BYU5_DIOCR|nr:probable WRKY transcription factor 54 isoform X2 [Dioscorea cayenensis subsp. rotundata]
MEKKVMNIKAAAMMEISRALGLISYLQAYLCPLIPAKKEMEQATNLLQEIMSSLLQSVTILNSIAAADQRIPYEDTATTVKRRRVHDSTRIVTTNPFCDGYQWKKYGEKDIKNSDFRRTYYKCTNEECKARKKVQQQDKNMPSNFMVIYDMQHICNNTVQETKKNLLSPSTSTINFGSILESSSFMMDNINQQEQTLSSISDQFQITNTVLYNDNISVAKAVQGAESTGDNMAGIFSPLSPLDCNEIQNALELFNLVDHEDGSFAEDEDDSLF